MNSVRDLPSSDPDKLSQRVQSLKLPSHRPTVRGNVLPWTICLFLGIAVGWLAVREFGRTVTAAKEDGRKIESAAASNGIGDGPKSAAAKSNGSSSLSDPNAVVHEAKGHLVARQLILVTPRVAGVMQKLTIEEGQIVHKDEVIARIEQDEYRFERDRAKGLYEQAKARLQELTAGYEPEEKEEASAEEDEARAQARQLELAYQRAQQLRKSSSASAAELEQAEASWKAMSARVRKLENRGKLVKRGFRQEKIDSAKAEVAQSKADLDRAEWRLSHTIIKAPTTGIVITKQAEEGNVVNPISFKGSYSICEMADLAALEVELTIQERDFAKIYDGQPCIVRPEAWPEREYKGVARRLPRGDRAKGAVPVRVKVEIPQSEAGKFLRPEMGAIVAFLKGPAR
jgi:HlyD family secretion protein